MTPHVVVPIPVHGRHPLVWHTIRRLFGQQGVRITILGIGDEADRAVCEAAGVVFHVHPNRPLGAKWQAGFTLARAYEPDAVLYCGSSDWVNADWCRCLLAAGHPIAGVRDVTFVDYPRTGGMRACYWPHYPLGHRRHLECTGGGRLLRREVLDACDWRVFAPHLANSLDWSMEQHVGHAEPVVDARLRLVSISCWAWPNKHQYEARARMPHVRRALPDDLFAAFPELSIFDPEATAWTVRAA